MIHYFLDPIKGFQKWRVFWRCARYCARIKDMTRGDWNGPPDACRNSKRDCANNQICNFYQEGYYTTYGESHNDYDESRNWGWEMVQDPLNKSVWTKVAGIRQSGCIDCPGTTAESCRDDGWYVNRRTFEDCVEICAEGKNPNNVQPYPPNKTTG